MANIKAQASGNWSATATWAGGVVPVAGDVVYFNSFTVTLDVNASVALLTTAAVTGIPFNGGSTSSNAGGGLTITTARTLTADIVAGTSQVITCGLGSQGTTITAATSAGFVGSTTTGVNGITCNHITEIVTIIGNIAGGTTAAPSCVLNNSTGTVNVTGNVTMTTGTSGTSGALTNGGQGTINLIGNSTGGSVNNSYGCHNASSGIFNITGNCFGGTGSNAYGFQNITTGTALITGNVFGGTGAGAGAFGANNGAGGTLTITGSATGGNSAGTNCSGARNGGTGTLIVRLAIGNNYGPSGAVNPCVGVESTGQGSLTFVRQLQFGPLGMSPVSGSIRLTPDTTNTAQFFVSTGVTKTLSDPAAVAGTYPATANVRLGTTYANGNLIGTCAVPAAGSVALGVPVDATTGTAVLTAANVQTALTSQGLTTARAANLDNLDVAASTRLATSGYTAPDNATIATINTNVSTNLDAKVSTRSTLTKSDVQASVIPLL